MNRRSVEVLWLLVLCALAFVTGLLLFSGDIALYLAPRMYPVAWFGFGMLCLLAGFQLMRLIKARRRDFGKKTRLYSLVFLIPLVLFATTPPTQDTAMSLTNPGLQIVGAEQAVTQTPEPESTETPAAQASELPLITSGPAAAPEATEMPVAAAADAADLMPCVLTDEAGEVPADTFGDYIYVPVEELQGQRISLYGFVYKDDAFPEGTLLVSRMLMTCCAADTSLVGFHVRVEDAAAFENDEWIEVTGTVQAFKIDYEGETYTMPILTDGEIRHRNAPLGDPYIYPTF